MFQNQYVDNISDTYASTTFKDKPSMEIHDAKTIQHHVESALQIWDLADAGDDGKLDLGPLLGPQNLVWGETSYPWRCGQGQEKVFFFFLGGGIIL